MGGTPMMSRNLRHFRVFLAVVQDRSASGAAQRCGVSQSAVTQALNKLDREAGGGLFQRTRKGAFLTERGRLFDARIRRAMDRLDKALAEVSPRLTLTATSTQLRALIAVTEAQNFALAARALGVASPSVHRAITQIEREAGRPLFERTLLRNARHATMPPPDTCRSPPPLPSSTRPRRTSPSSNGRDAGRVVIGALPLSRSVRPARGPWPAFTSFGPDKG